MDLKDPKNVKPLGSRVPTLEVPILLMKAISQTRTGKELANRVMRKDKSMNNLSLKDEAPLGTPGDYCNS